MPSATYWLRVPLAKVEVNTKKSGASGYYSLLL